MKNIDESVLKSAISLIQENQNIVIIPHHNPDGDALGSSFGLRLVLQNLGKNARVIAPNDYPEFLHWLPGSQEAVIWFRQRKTAIRAIEKADLLIFLDFNDLDRVENMKETIEATNVPKLMIDHHPYPKEIADVIISDTAASSTSELVTHFIKWAGFTDKINKKVASCLLTGIITDTGSFSYNSSHPETYEALSLLLETGVNKDKIYDNVYNNYSFQRMQLMGFALNERMKYIPKYNTAYIYLTKEDLKTYNFRPGDSEGFVNLPLSIKGVVFAAFFMEKDDKIKMSLRSKFSFPANKVASDYFNGGGHLNAAGGHSNLSMDEAIKQFESVLKEYKPDFDNLMRTGLV